MKNNLKYTLKEAANAVDKSKSTLMRYVKNGKLSALRDENSVYIVDASELFRVFPDAHHDAHHESPNESVRIGDESPKKEDLTVENMLMESRIEMLEIQLSDARKDKEDLKKERDDWKFQANSLLGHDKKKGFFARLFGK